jgi:hypothetical protein
MKKSADCYDLSIGILTRQRGMCRRVFNSLLVLKRVTFGQVLPSNYGAILKF